MNCSGASARRQIFRNPVRRQACGDQSAHECRPPGGGRFASRRTIHGVNNWKSASSGGYILCIASYPTRSAAYGVTEKSASLRKRYAIHITANYWNYISGTLVNPNAHLLILLPIDCGKDLQCNICKIYSGCFVRQYGGGLGVKKCQKLIIAFFFRGGFFLVSIYFFNFA